MGGLTISKPLDTRDITTGSTNFELKTKFNLKIMSSIWHYEIDTRLIANP